MKDDPKTNLIEIQIKNETAYADSTTLCKLFDQEHRYVSRVIKRLISYIERQRKNKDTDPWSDSPNELPNVIEEIRSYRGNSFTIYLMNSQFVSLLLMRFKGDLAFKWQIKYTIAFSEAREEIARLTLKEVQEPQQYARLNDLWTHSKQAIQKQADQRQEDLLGMEAFIKDASGQGEDYELISTLEDLPLFKALVVLQHKNPSFLGDLQIKELSDIVLTERLAQVALKKYMRKGRSYVDICESATADVKKWVLGTVEEPRVTYDIIPKTADPSR